MTERCLLADYHMHSAFSDDSQAPMEDMVRRALELGLAEICFTEHVDYGVKTVLNCDYPSYLAGAARMREKYGDRITVRAGDDMGNEAFQVDYTNIFPVVNGKVDFTGREEPEEEIAETTKSVYVALSALLTDRNLPAEEEYRHRQAVYEGLPLLDWPAFAALGPAGQDTETMQSLLQYLESQTLLSAHEISCLQGGAFRVDGWYATWYTILLGRAFVSAPEQYVRCMADAGRLYKEDQALAMHTAYGCEEGQILEEAEEAIRELLYHSGALRTWQEELCAREIYEKIQKMMGTNN